MPCSHAQVLANRANALKSTGPKTPEGKARSRANGLKHGLTGDGIVIPTEDAAELDLRFAALEAEMKPAGTMARQLVGRVALMTIRLDRAAEHEAKAISHKMRKARGEFDDARLAEMENYYSWIASEPATNARRLRMTPEGLKRLLQVMTDLRDELDHPDGHRWDWSRCEQFHHIIGLRRVDVPVSRPRALSDAMEGNFRNLSQSDGGDLDVNDRREWARVALLAVVDGELAKLRDLLDEFDHEGLELDREEAAHRVIFDPSPAAVLARKYEAASERSLYRALREFRDIQGSPTQIDEQESVAAESEAEMASSLPDVPDEIDEEPNVDLVEPRGSEPILEAIEESYPDRREGRKSRKNRPRPGR